MKDVVLDENEHIVASLVPDDPEQLYKHKNQVVAITNKRLLFARHTGVSNSFEGSYKIHSIDIRTVERVRHGKHFAIGGVLAGIILLGLGSGYAYGGATFQLVGPGVIFVPLIAIPSGIILVFGLKRRFLVFETASANYKWISNPFAFRKTEGIAASVREYFDARRHDEINGTESWLTEKSPPAASAEQVSWYHYVVVLLFPPVGVLWGIVNLFMGKKCSGLLLFFGSIAWYLLIMGILLLTVPK